MEKNNMKPRKNSSKPASLINIESNRFRDVTDYNQRPHGWFNHTDKDNEAENTDCLTGFSVHAGEITQRNYSPNRYPISEDVDVGNGDGENHYKQTMKKPVNDNQREYTVNCSLVDDHKNSYINNLDRKRYDSQYHSMTHNDVGVQATVYHCNACRRHLKFNQDYMPATKERVDESEPESIQTNNEEELETRTASKQITHYSLLSSCLWCTGSDQSNHCDAVETSSETSEYNKSKSTNKEPRDYKPATNERVFESEPESVQTNNEEELETRTASKQISTVSDQSNHCDAEETSRETSEYNKSKSNNKEPRKRVHSLDKKIQTDLRANQPDKQRSIFTKIKQVFTKINGYGQLAKCLIIFVIVVIPLLAAITLVSGYFNITLKRFVPMEEEPKIKVEPKGYFDIAAYVLKSVWTVYTDQSWNTFRSLTALFYN